jgi:hypothetical protein
VDGGGSGDAAPPAPLAAMAGRVATPDCRAKPGSRALAEEGRQDDERRGGPSGRRSPAAQPVAPSPENGEQGSAALAKNDWVNTPYELLNGLRRRSGIP